MKEKLKNIDKSELGLAIGVFICITVLFGIGVGVVSKYTNLKAAISSLLVLISMAIFISIFVINKGH